MSHRKLQQISRFTNRTLPVKTNQLRNAGIAGCERANMQVGRGCQSSDMQLGRGCDRTEMQVERGCDGTKSR